MRRFTSGIVSGMAAAIVAAVLPVAAADTSFDQGVKEFSAKRYSEAARLFEKSVAEPSGQNATAYYYLGSSLVHLRKNSAAEAAFQKCLSLKPDPKLTSYCVSALRGLGSSQTASALTSTPAADRPNAAQTAALQDLNYVQKLLPRLDLVEDPHARAQFPAGITGGTRGLVTFYIQRCKEQTTRVKETEKRAREILEQKLGATSTHTIDGLLLPYKKNTEQAQAFEDHWVKMERGTH